MQKRKPNIVSLFMAIVMAAVVFLPSAALAMPSGSRDNGTMTLDPSTLNVPKAGGAADEAEPEDEQIVHSPDDIVRVSIFMESPSAMDAGHSLRGSGTNAAVASYRNSLQREQSAVTKQIERKLGRTIEVKWNLTLAVNAISAYVRYGDIETIKKVPGVKDVQLENRYQVPDDEVVSPNTANTSSSMVGASNMWGVGYTGAGSKIAIIDTGIDVTHQSFNSAAFDYAIEQYRQDYPDKTVTLTTAADYQGLILNGNGAYFSSKIPFGYNYVDTTAEYIDHVHDGDTQGEHGSHVAGISAANRYIPNSTGGYDVAAESVLAVGMAPDAQLFIMKVFGAQGGAYDSDYMAAIEDCIVLDVDVVNLSLGSSIPGFAYSDGYQDVMNRVVDTMQNEGLVVSISAGNSYAFDDFFGYVSTDEDPRPDSLYTGDVRLHTGGSPGSFINSLCVASAENIFLTGMPLKFTPESGTQFNSTYTETSGNNPPISTIAKDTAYEFVYIDAPGNADDYAAVNPTVSLEGKIVIVNRGSISFYEKGNNAIDYKPAALIVANNASGTISMALDGYEGTFPMVSITQSDARDLKVVAHTAGSYTYYTGTVIVSNVAESTQTSSLANAEMSEFSSWGAPESLLMKPEITAPGGNIYSVFGTNNTSDGAVAGGSDKYELMSGTSMAAPHITGLAALVAQYLRENPIGDTNSVFYNSNLAAQHTTRQIIQSLMMSTAVPMRPYANNTEYLPVIQQGSGLVNVTNAITAASVIMMSTTDNTLTAITGGAADGKVKAELGDDPGKTGVYSYSFTIYNLADTTVTYTLSTDLFTQTISGDYVTHGTTNLPSGGVTYIWKSGSHDVDKNGITDNADVQAILDYLTGKRAADSIDLTAADFNNDTTVNTRDAYALLDYLESPSDAYTIEAHGQASVTVNINLTTDQRNALAAFGDAGAFLQGYTYVTGQGRTFEGASYEDHHSIPILGYYGSWTDPSMFTNVSKAYDNGQLPYVGNGKTNYMTVSYNGTSTVFTGNPYVANVENPYTSDRLAIRSDALMGNIYYTLLRAAGTTGFAVTKLDAVGGNVTDILNASVTGSNVVGAWGNLASADIYQNTNGKSYTVNKTPAFYGLAEGDAFRIGYYAIPEYNGMMMHQDNIQDANAGKLNLDEFKELILSGDLGRGAYMGYEFVIDDTVPTVSATLSGSNLTITATDNLDIAYIAVMSLDGTTKYFEKAPAARTTSVTESGIILTQAIANEPGYVAVFVGDFAGNEAAVAVKVNNNTSQNQDFYVLADTLEPGKEYVIASSNAEGSCYILGYTTSTTGSIIPITSYSPSAKASYINAGNSDTGNKPYINPSAVDSTAVWTAAADGTSFNLKNNDVYIRRSTNTNINSLEISTSTTFKDWDWDSANSALYHSSRYLSFNSSSNVFEMTSTLSSIYLFKKMTATTTIDPGAVTGISLNPTAVEVYLGGTTELTATVMPLTASDRTVDWTSGDTSVATVDNGIVTGVATGTATITAASHANPAYTATCEVTVVSVSKNLNGIFWDDNGDASIQSFTTDTAANTHRTGTPNPLNVQLSSAFLDGALAPSLYGVDVNANATAGSMYEVNTSTYEATELGALFVPAMDTARSNSTVLGDCFVYSYAYFLLFGTIDKIEMEGYNNSGLPLGMLDTSETLGGAYIAGVALKRASTKYTYYILDETGKIWETEMSSTGTLLLQREFTEPKLVVDTGIGTSFMYQTLYYDGTYLYWGHTDGPDAELIIINPGTGAVYRAGSFGMPTAVGFYSPDGQAPKSGNTDVSADRVDLSDVHLAATREELMTPEIMARYAAEAQRLSSRFDRTNSEIGATSVETRCSNTLDSASTLMRGVINETEGERGVDTTPAVGTEEVTVVIKDNDETGYNGKYSIEYNADKLTFIGLDSDADNSSYNHETANGIGTVTFAFADIGIAAGNTIATLHFETPDRNSTVTVTRLEHNEEFTAEAPVQNPIIVNAGEKYLVDITTYNYTNGAATVAFTGTNLPDADGKFSSGEVTFTVDCALACAVGTINRDGSITPLSYTSVDGNGLHTYTVTVVENDIQIVVVVRGDATLDGELDGVDATAASQYVVGNVSFDEFRIFAVDYTFDGFDDNDAIILLYVVTHAAVDYPWYQN